MRLHSIILVGFFLSSTLSYVYAQVDGEEPFVFLKAGLFSERDECADVLDSVDAKWNIQNKWVAGCMVSEELLDSIKLFNATTRQQLSQKYGEGWEEKYRKERSAACDEHLLVLEQLFIDTIERKNGDHVERISNNKYFSYWLVEIIDGDYSSTPHAPITIKNINDSSDSILYRGFPNHVEINLGQEKHSKFRIESPHCTMITNYAGNELPAGQYILKPHGNHREATITIYSDEELLLSRTFKLLNLPDPEIYINDKRSDSTLPIETFDSEFSIEIRYPEEITLRNEFEVINWEIQLDGQIIGGKGDIVTIEQLQKLTHLSVGNQFSLICTVKGPDGIQRKKAGAFILK